MPTQMMTTLPPSSWRVLNKLFYLGIANQVYEATVPKLIDGQNIAPDRLVKLENDALIVAHIGRFHPVRLADLQVGDKFLRQADVLLRLAPAGTSLVVRNRPNNVIGMLGHQASHTVHSLRTEAEIDDVGLIAMNEDGLIEPTESDIRLATFKQLPRDMRLRLTRKGRTYFPR